MTKLTGRASPTKYNAAVKRERADLRSTYDDKKRKQKEKKKKKKRGEKEH
jgi:hypothetical protein